MIEAINIREVFAIHLILLPLFMLLIADRFDKGGSRGCYGAILISIGIPILVACFLRACFPSLKNDVPIILVLGTFDIVVLLQVYTSFEWPKTQVPTEVDKSITAPQKPPLVLMTPNVDDELLQLQEEVNYEIIQRYYQLTLKDKVESKEAIQRIRHEMYKRKEQMGGRNMD